MNKTTEFTLDAVRGALSFIPSDDRELWWKITAALKDEYGDEAKGLWLDWSTGYDKFNPSDANSVWKSFKSGKITIGTLIYEAKQFGWQPKRTDSKKITPEDYARKQAERERRRAADEEHNRERAARAAKRATEIWESAIPAASHPYLERKGILPHGARLLPVWERVAPDEKTGELITISLLNTLVIPMYSGPKTISSLQFVFERPCPILERDRDFLPGGTKQGCYFVLGAITRSTLRILFCEGFATGASLREATGAVVVVAFDAGNLEAVATAMRAQLPDVEMIIAGDNDLWSKGNPGARKANAAAWAVSGRVALPAFDNHDDEPTDFNDLRDSVAIRQQVEAAIAPADPEHYKPDCFWRAAAAPTQPAVVENTGSTSPSSSFQGGDGAVQTQDPASSCAPTPDDAAHDEDEKTSVATERDVGLQGFFRIRGYDHDKYYIFQHERKQLAVYSPGSFTDSGFLALADLQFWETGFPGAQGGFCKKSAMNWFMRLAHQRGIFDPSFTRGRGAWVDRGRVVLHMGNTLVVDGTKTPITDFDSRYVYELDRSLPALASAPLTLGEGRKLLDIAKSFRWTKPASAPMLAGWIALAPLCGAMKWRPHVWLTGGAGTGKSWILNNFVHPLMNGMDVFAQGNSTEAGVRQTLRQDALPVLFDESEKNNDRERQRVDGVLALIRQASTESAAQTLKGSASGDAMHFHIRSMFCLASIQVGLEKQADYERMAVLALRAKRDGDAQVTEKWKALQEEVYTFIERDETLPARLFLRSLRLLPITLQNIEVFSTAAALKFGSQRDGDQYGTLMAGAWSLISDGVAASDDATEMLSSYDWQEYMEHTESDESIRALHAVMEAKLRVSSGVELSVHEVVQLACHRLVDGVDLSAGMADALLQRNGMRVKDQMLLFSNTSQALRELMQGTPFESDLRGHLLRVDGATRFDNATVKIGAGVAKCVAIPVGRVINDDPIMGQSHAEDRPF